MAWGDGGRPSARLAAGAVLVLLLLTVAPREATAAPMDLSSPVEHAHYFMFPSHGGQRRPSTVARAESTTARYVQLSNGSRFVCDTVSERRRDPLDPSNYVLGQQMEALMGVLHRSDSPCVHHAVEKHVAVFCWDMQVRWDIPTENRSRFLGRRQPRAPQLYWAGRNHVGRYVATVYGDGDDCPYVKNRPIETEVRFYCRYTDFQNPMPYMSLYESSQCRYVLELLTSKVCSVPYLDHPSEEETVQCQMLDD
ncbi:hypothetical protein NESM_000313800 [Novymonas esmeraldas]|uniref:MRH domain-containing protein n=1 Tax=Novymonas esmeraldas TaxID=1808958 RepID=A0AAW0EKN1_9TRYP